MPRAKKQTTVDDDHTPARNQPYACGKDADWGGYINLRMDVRERSDFDGWAGAEGDALYQHLDDMVSAGMKFGLSYDAENEAYVATFTGAGCVGDRARYVLQARAGTWYEATALLLYKHLILLRGDWGSFMPSTARTKFG